jgi:hypothetical protein
LFSSLRPLAPFARVVGAHALTPPPGFSMKVGFGAPATYFTDAGKASPAASDGDLVYTAADVSGNGYDLVQATAGNRPVLDLYSFPGRQAMLTQSWRNAAIQSKGANPVPLNSLTGCTIGIVFKMMNTCPYSGVGIQMGVGAAVGPAGYMWSSSGFPLPHWTGFAPGGSQSPEAPDVTPGPHSAVQLFGPSSWQLHMDGTLICTGGAAVAASTSSGIVLGGVGSSVAYTSYLGVIVYPTLLSGSTLADLKAYIASFTTGGGSTFPTSLPCTVCVGDSLTQGTNTASSEANTWPEQMLASMTTGATLHRGLVNLGNGGERVTDWQTLAPIWVDPYYDAARPKNICFIWCGTNDGGGGTA